MPIERVFQGTIDHLQILDKDGNVDTNLEPKLPNELLDKMYRLMVLGRLWDKKCIALQRTGRMYTYPPLEGQEAVTVGATLALGNEDWFIPSYRESFGYYIRGLPLDIINLGWMGVEEGLKLDKKAKSFPYAIPIGTQHTHATGVAYALKLKGERSAVLVCGGDGSTSEGDFHDALNFAGVFQVPCVFLIVNNQWAISVPRKSQTKSETIAQKALGYGFKAIQVDGNDILAVYNTVKEALENARSGSGPFLIEAVTYRIGAHTTADDPKKYRSEEEVNFWRDRDPIKRLKVYLAKKGVWNEDYEAKVNAEAVKIIDDAVQKAETYKQEPKNMFNFLYAKMTKDLENQMKECFEA
ncbi:1-deoxy-D-xylulose-5-phosphate synthase [Candidatus Bilamarchaeum dharawalense]|uniref:1-deoxy-D-xylulose-5-phosphate synthase n=1 Tax=Candidatus Bilamarchaeum dharawalense TaxID=2885759 RepID=A0A5E4LM97_9ARCH|nr:1-deoxy-D-xylulose-5-phosphate synthase [Candidatus Bilamarchaeum dharawalense]